MTLEAQLLMLANTWENEALAAKVSGAPGSASRASVFESCARQLAAVVTAERTTMAEYFGAEGDLVRR